MYDFMNNIIIKEINGNAHFCFIFEKGRKAITSTDNEIVCYDTEFWIEQWKYEEKNVPIFGFHKSLEGIIFGKNVKFWSKKLIADLS